MEALNIRPAERRDCSAIVSLIRELALYEDMLDQAKVTTEDLERDGFDSTPPYFQCLVAEVPKGEVIGAENKELDIVQNESDVQKCEVIGYALYFHKYSTWVGKVLHLEDFYVTPAYRANGVGTKLLRQLAKIAVDSDYSRLTLECLGWNKPAIDYYKRLNAMDLTEMEGWHVFRFVKSDLPKLAGYES